MKIVNCYVLLLFLLLSREVWGQENDHYQQFLSALDSIRTSLKIPGMAVAVAKGDSILLQTGLGYADLNNHIKVTPSTTFRVASISKTFASTIIMQLVEQGKLNLDTPVTAYGIDFGNPRITVKHILTHTSEGEPGAFYQYNGYRFSFLQKVIEQVTGIPYYRLLMENIVQPLHMTSTAPGISLFNYFQYRQQRKDMMPFFDTAFIHLARPYDLDNNKNIVETNYLDEFGTSGGITTCVTDLLKYSSAIDRNKFVNSATQKIIFTSNKTSKGEQTPYGLGWFVQAYKGVNFYWHYGQTQGESGIFVKVPSMNLTLAVLTNSVRLSSPFPLGDGDLFTSPVGQLFYKCFITKNVAVSSIDFSRSIEVVNNFEGEYKDFYSKEIITQATIDNFRADTLHARALYNLYAKLNFKNIHAKHRDSIIVAINHVGVGQEVSKKFVLKNADRVHVAGVGENCSSDLKSWCDYGWIEDEKGNTIWQMQSQHAAPAGGAIKNQKVETTISLPAGSYTLKYKSDWAHAFDNWDSLPPDNFLWGIVLSYGNNN